MKGTGFLPARADSTPGRQGSFWGTLTRAPFVRLASRGPAFVLLTVYEGHEFEEAEGRAAGADAWVAKTAVTKKLLPAVRSLLAARAPAASAT